MKKNQYTFRVDVEEILRNKNPKLAKRLPRFLINYLKKIVCQKKINEILSKYGHKKGHSFAGSILNFGEISYEIIGEENIPSSGRFIFVCNHPLGGLDGIILINYFGKKYPAIKFPVNDILLNISNFSDIFVPINKHGMQNRKNAQLIDDAYESDTQILMFPAGYVSRKRWGVISDLKWQKNFITKAIEHKRDVIPLHMNGKNSSFFYNLSNIRKVLGIKANLEMLYLPGELFKQKERKFTITIGKPISYTYFDKSKPRKEWAEFVKEIVYNLSRKK